MPDKRKHRGPHPDDASLFSQAQVSILQAALEDYIWLLNHGYASNSSLKLVGDRFELVRRQRLALMRCGCTDTQAKHRRARCVGSEQIRARPICIDGYNVLITVEAFLSDGLLFHAVDGCFRDLASLHGSYRKVEETIPALDAIGRVLEQLEPVSVSWLFDKPVSNSGRLKKIVNKLATGNRWPWRVQLTDRCDYDLTQCRDIIVTSDSAVLDKCDKWFNLIETILAKSEQTVHIVDLSAAKR
ncbi:MAG: DUF434 domain-containing protein [Sedimentisphaerales bacterium]|nr:DUF434 domain-containing protein [Sedimentisphaerales bacterium]